MSIFGDIRSSWVTRMRCGWMDLFKDSHDFKRSLWVKITGRLIWQVIVPDHWLSHGQWQPVVFWSSWKLIRLVVHPSESPTISIATLALSAFSFLDTPAYINGTATFSSAETLGSKLKVWKTKPISLFHLERVPLSSIWFTSWSFSRYLPDVGVSETAKNIHQN